MWNLGSVENPGYLVDCIMTGYAYYTHFTIVELFKHFSSTGMLNWYNTTHHLHAVLPVAEDR